MAYGNTTDALMQTLSNMQSSMQQMVSTIASGQQQQTMMLSQALNRPNIDAGVMGQFASMQPSAPSPFNMMGMGGGSPIYSMPFYNQGLTGIPLGTAAAIAPQAIGYGRQAGGFFNDVWRVASANHAAYSYQQNAQMASSIAGGAGQLAIGAGQVGASLMGDLAGTAMAALLPFPFNLVGMFGTSFAFNGAANAIGGRASDYLNYNQQYKEMLMNNSNRFMNWNTSSNRFYGGGLNIEQQAAVSGRMLGMSNTLEMGRGEFSGIASGLINNNLLGKSSDINSFANNLEKQVEFVKTAARILNKSSDAIMGLMDEFKKLGLDFNKIDYYAGLLRDMSGITGGSLESVSGTLGNMSVRTGSGTAANPTNTYKGGAYDLALVGGITSDLSLKDTPYNRNMLSAYKQQQIALGTSSIAEAGAQVYNSTVTSLMNGPLQNLGILYAKQDENGNWVTDPNAVNSIGKSNYSMSQLASMSSAKLDAMGPVAANSWMQYQPTFLANMNGADRQAVFGQAMQAALKQSPQLGNVQAVLQTLYNVDPAQAMIVADIVGKPQYASAANYSLNVAPRINSGSDLLNNYGAFTVGGQLRSKWYDVKNTLEENIFKPLTNLVNSGEEKFLHWEENSFGLPSKDLLSGNMSPDARDTVLNGSGVWDVVKGGDINAIKARDRNVLQSATRGLNYAIGTLTGDGSAPADEIVRALRGDMTGIESSPAAVAIGAFRSSIVDDSNIFRNFKYSKDKQWSGELDAYGAWKSEIDKYSAMNSKAFTYDNLKPLIDGLQSQLGDKYTKVFGDDNKGSFDSYALYDDLKKLGAGVTDSKGLGSPNISRLGGMQDVLQQHQEAVNAMANTLVSEVQTMRGAVNTVNATPTTTSGSTTTQDGTSDIVNKIFGWRK